ncbi:MULTISPECIES: acetoacetyl-CoA reductase [Cohaesibacter]|uniref:acetoacetyl-CoA reductase n=1 Tax=Cohaesibacter TaxID=655352 RepID=UPI000DE83A05|nr:MULTISPECIES: acetoacetyl-CoA reductase [Cohaesibacter]TLP46828.1 acetoacetyl-CoA reductase [Cohaesibacter sp. CAU 1516]
MSKVAVVTGGTRGIGEAISIELKQAGFLVAANYCGNDERARAFSERTGIKAYKWDVGDFEACKAGLRQIEEDLGIIDVVVNNAGITRDGMLHKLGVDEWHEVINTNLNSMYYMTKPVIDEMRARAHGRIINISSINGQKGQMGQTNYSAAKAGVIGFTKALAQETARKGVTVNCICPGYIDTDMVAAVPEKVLESIVSSIPVGRLGQAEEIAAMVAFLASEKAGFITGAVMTVNGGQYIANG